MKKITIAAVLLLLAAGVFGGEDKNERKPSLGVDAEVSQTVPATACYVLFLSEVSATGVVEAKEKIDQKLKSFAADAQKEFPGLETETRTVNVGTRDFSSYRATENPFMPTVARVLICTLPPDELQAAKLLDFGVKAGLAPFCAAARDGAFGAVYYGVNAPEKTLDALYAKGSRELRAKADKLAAMRNGKAGLMHYISCGTPRDNNWELRFKDIKVTLPAEFCGTDKDRIKVTLQLRGDFEIDPLESGK